MSGPDWIQTSDLQWLHQFREHFPVYSAPTPQMNKFRDIFRSILLQLLNLVTFIFRHSPGLYDTLYPQVTTGGFDPPSSWPFTRRASTAPRRSYGFNRPL